MGSSRVEDLLLVGGVKMRLQSHVHALQPLRFKSRKTSPHQDFTEIHFGMMTLVFSIGKDLCMCQDVQQFICALADLRGGD